MKWMTRKGEIFQDAWSQSIQIGHPWLYLIRYHFYLNDEPKDEVLTIWKFYLFHRYIGGIIPPRFLSILIDKSQNINFNKLFPPRYK